MTIRKLYPKGHPKHEESPWIYEYTNPETKKRVRATPKSGLKKDAEALRRKIQRELEDGTHVSKFESVTIAEAADIWLKECEVRRKAKDRMTGNTLAHYQSAVRSRIVPHLGKKLVSELKATDVQAYIYTLLKDLSPHTANSALIILKLIVRFSVGKGWVRVNPLADSKIRVPGRTEKRRKIPNREELQAILKAVVVKDPKDRWECHTSRIGMVTLALFAGLRLGEIFGLQWESVDFVGRQIHVVNSSSRYDGLKAPKTKAGFRVLPMSDPVHALLRQIAEERGLPTSGYVFLNPWGKPIQVFQGHRYWRKVLERANLITEDGKAKYVFHSLRHANVSLLIQEGLDAFRIKGMIGHASINTTLDIYGHMFPDDGEGRSAAQSLAANFSPAPPMQLLRGSSTRRAGPAARDIIAT